jgi:alkylhydroperoxidase family enzyme
MQSSHPRIDLDVAAPGASRALDEAPYYTERERAALAWAEALTLVADGRVPDDVYEEVREHFDEAEVAALTLAAVAINSWTRVAISLRMPPARRSAVAA